MPLKSQVEYVDLDTQENDFTPPSDLSVDELRLEYPKIKAGFDPNEINSVIAVPVKGKTKVSSRLLGIGQLFYQTGTFYISEKVGYQTALNVERLTLFPLNHESNPKLYPCFKHDLAERLKTRSFEDLTRPECDPTKGYWKYYVATADNETVYYHGVDIKLARQHFTKVCKYFRSSGVTVQVYLYELNERKEQYLR